MVVKLDIQVQGWTVNSALFYELYLGYNQQLLRYIFLLISSVFTVQSFTETTVALFELFLFFILSIIVVSIT